ncbi:hypothetical protein TNCV_4726821 [Trichonephila clavipes]|nr:hypothetical protein TNCV_4726821 [Trichonephila clavipes]
MCEGLQQTPAEVTAAESVETLKNWRRTSGEAFSLGVFWTVRLKQPASNTKGQTPHTKANQRIGHVGRSSVERLERQMRSFMNRVESLMSQKADGKKTLKCWTCGRRVSAEKAAGHAKALKLISAFKEGGVGKLINDHLVGRRLPDFGKPTFQCVKFRQRVPVRMEFL